MTSISSLASSWASSLFSKLDTSNQGYLTKSDLESAFSNISSSSGSSSTSSTTNADNLFSALDSNGDSQVSKDELTTALESLASQLDNQFNSMRMGQGGGQMPPPPPSDGSGNASGIPSAPPANDSGFTKDQLTSQLSEIGSSDSQRSSFISNVVNNFDQADTDGDGKVTFQEAQALNQSLNASSSTGSTSSSSSGSSSNSSSTSQDQVLSQIMQLLQAYGVGGSDRSNQQNGFSSLLSQMA
jgi:Ca2+-binding EF-hand superfamily protein